MIQITDNLGRVCLSLSRDRPPVGPTKGNCIMFTTNEGTVDRVLRVALGAGLLLWFVMDQSQGFWHYAKLIGIMPLLTGLVGACPLYSVLGVSTCELRKG